MTDKKTSPTFGLLDKRDEGPDLLSDLAGKLAYASMMQEEWSILVSEVQRKYSAFTMAHADSPTHLILNQAAKENFYRAVEFHNSFKKVEQPDPYSKDQFMGLEVVWADVKVIRVGILL